ncbi:hypothetical protein LCGC14_0572710 [marine sediment metagenome]|uniref:Uncharacterized protein n=1 Tax=marine sediment metagenome TaxID=412755 RepID=A0A0F9RIR6_9ZZZZ
MAFKIVNGKLVRTTDFGTAAQKKAGRKITGTLGVISGPKTKQAAARKISEVFSPSEPSPRPSSEIRFGPEARKLLESGELSAPTGTLGLGQPASLRSPLLRPLEAPRAQPRSIGEALAVQEPGSLRFMAGGSLAAEERSRAPSPIQLGRGGFGEAVPQAQARLQPPPNIIQGTGPSPIQLGNPSQTLGDISPLFPEGTVVGRAGGTTAAQLPDGTIVDLTRVETYGQLAAESLFRWMDTGNPDMRPTNIREEWAMSFRHLWEDNYENVSDFLESMGYRQVPGTNNWIRENPMDLTSPGSGGGSGGSRVIQGSRGGTFQPAARSNRSSFGLTQWGITPGA